MTEDEATLAILDALDAVGIAYMIVGSLSSNYYGVPRSTQDADLVIQVSGQSLAALAQRIGPPLHLDPQMSFELVTGTTRNIVHLAGTPFKIELFHLSEDPHDQERFRRRQGARLLGREIFLPTVEDVVVTKLRWCFQARRPKDQQDVHDVIALRGEQIDWQYVYGWCDQHGTRETLEAIRSTIPPS